MAMQLVFRPDYPSVTNHNKVVIALILSLHLSVTFCYTTHTNKHMHTYSIHSWQHTIVHTVISTHAHKLNESQMRGSWNKHTHPFKKHTHSDN